MIPTRFITTAVALLLQFAIYIAFSRWLKRHYPTRPGLITVLRVLFLAFNALTVIAAFTRPNISGLPQLLTWFVVYPYFIWQGSTVVLGLLLLAGWLLLAPIRVARLAATRIPRVRDHLSAMRGAPRFRRFDASRRVFIRRSALGLAATTFGATTYGMYLERSSYDVHDETFLLPGLLPGLDGFTIGLVTDIHSSAYMTRADMEEIVRLMNGLRCDLALVGGDFVNSLTEEVTPFAEAFSALRAPFGVFGVTGNHDYYTRDTAAVIREVEASGIALLRNDKLVISRNGARMYLAGVDDPGRQAGAWPSDAPLLTGASLPIPKILLCHRPYPFPTASKLGVDLMLSGHTHGGQVVLGRFGNTILTPAAAASPYVAGRYTLGQSQLYVSRGVGTVGIPVRINCRPEITRIILRSGPVPA